MRPNVSDDGNGVGRFGSLLAVLSNSSSMPASGRKADISQAGFGRSTVNDRFSRKRTFRHPKIR